MIKMIEGSQFKQVGTMFSQSGKIDLTSIINEQLASSLQRLDNDQQFDNIRVNDLICSGKISLSLYL